MRGGTWDWRDQQWTLRQDIGPAPRSGSTLAFDGDRGRIVLFGPPADDGSGAGLVTNDTWELPAAVVVEFLDGGGNPLGVVALPQGIAQAVMEFHPTQVGEFAVEARLGASSVRTLHVIIPG